MAFTCPPRSQLTVSSCQQPWPRSLAHCCFRKCIFKPPWLWDQPGNVPARGGSSQKAVWNYAPLCHMQRNTVATPQWSALSSHHLFPTVSRYKVFCSEEMAQALVLLHAGWSHSICLWSAWAATPLGRSQRGGGKILSKGCFFSYLSADYLSKLLSVQHHCIGAKQCCIYLFKLAESAC